MDIKYIMQKSRYKFSCENKTPLYDVSKLTTYKKEVSLFLKELYMYNINLKQLSMQKPPAIIKDELLNLALICGENEAIAKSIALDRVLPYKALCNLTTKPQKFFERWQGYILSYFILINNSKYNTIYSYLNILRNDSLGNNKVSSDTSSIPSIKKGEEVTGIVLKNKNKNCYVLTSIGEFYAIAASTDITIGEICSGIEKSQRSYFKYPLRVFIVILIVMSSILLYQYKRIQSTAVIRSRFYLTLEVNYWGRVVKVTSLNEAGNKIKESKKILNKSLDTAVVSILDAGFQNSFLKENSSINIYISSDNNVSPNMDNTKKYIEEKKIQVIINNNGRKIPVE